MKPFTTFRSLLLATSLVAVSGCGGASATTTDDPVTTTTATTASLSILSALTPEETATLLFVREEEKMARDVYLSLYDLWGSQIFQNIALGSEQQHMDSVLLLINNLGLTDPVVSDAVGDFTDPEIDDLYDELVDRGDESLAEALRVGGFIEEFDMLDLQDAIDEAMDGTNQLAVIQTYTNLLCGSRNHLRAFVGQYESTTGTDYVAQVLDQTSVDTLADSPQEQCGS